MRPFVRGEEPELLKDKGPQWAAAWVELRRQKPSASFQWAVHEGVRVNLHLLPSLKVQTQDHCAFCDGFPVAGVSAETIEHFRSKTSYPQLAYTWANLYYSCSACQRGKLQEDSDDLLRPDDPDYQFSDYFYWDFESGHLMVNPRSSRTRQAQAEVTLRLYRLNEDSRPTYRKENRRRWWKLKDDNEDIDRWAYRDFISQQE